MSAPGVGRGGGAARPRVAAAAVLLGIGVGVVALAGGGGVRDESAVITGVDLPRAAGGRSVPPLAYRLNNPAPGLVPESRANPWPVADKFGARVRSLDERAALRAFEGAPPVIPHATADMNIQTCRACHAEGLRAGDQVARMVSHTYLQNCTQCHVEAAHPLMEDGAGAVLSTFVGLRPSGYGGTRAWAGAPPVMPHTTFMRTNCVSCHGEHGYDGWRPDHLSRSNCVQCHTPAAEFDQLAPSFGVPDVPDGVARLIGGAGPGGGGDGR